MTIEKLYMDNYKKSKKDRLNPNDIDEEGRKKAEATLIEAVDEAEYLGAKGIAFLAGKWEEATKDKAYEQLLKTTINVSNYAEKKGMGSCRCNT